MPKDKSLAWCRFLRRLAGIDAPEKRQPFGTVAKAALSTLLMGKPVVVQRSANAPLALPWEYFKKCFDIS